MTIGSVSRGSDNDVFDDRAHRVVQSQEKACKYPVDLEAAMRRTCVVALVGEIEHDSVFCRRDLYATQILDVPWLLEGNLLFE